MSLRGRSFLVTGGAGGIGQATGRALLESGAVVALLDRDEDGLAAAEADLADHGGSLEVRVVDVTDSAAVGNMVAELDATRGLDGAVNAAGILQLGTIADVAEEDWDRVLDVNLKGTYIVCKAVISVLERRGGGAIVNLASISGRTKSYFSAPNYVASKAGVIGLTMALAAQHAAQRVRVNCVAPGVIETPMTAAYSEEQWAAVRPTIPLGRVGRSSEVAAVVTALLSDQFSYVTGQTINVNGGQFMQ